MKQWSRHFGLMAALLFLSHTVLAAEPAFRSGAYDELIVARDSATQQVTGYFSSETGGGRFSCIFYFKGQLVGSQASIVSYFPEEPNQQIDGTLTVTGAGALQIVLKEEHCGCFNVRHFADANDPAVFTLSQAHDDWQSIMIVKAAKSYFYESPEAKNHRKAYLVKGDGVGVKKSKDAWLEIDFPSPDRTTSGWMKSSDFF